MTRAILASGVCLGLIAMAFRSTDRMQQSLVLHEHGWMNSRMDTTKKPKPDSTQSAAYWSDTTKKPKPDSLQALSFSVNRADTTKKPKPDSLHDEEAYAAFR